MEGAEGICHTHKKNIINQPDHLPELLGTKAQTKRDPCLQPHMKRGCPGRTSIEKEALDPAKAQCPSVREGQGGYVAVGGWDRGREDGICSFLRGNRERGQCLK